LSFRDVEELLAQRGIEVSYETIRCWTIKFGPQIARNLKRQSPGAVAALASGRDGLQGRMVSACISGAPSMTRARSWIS
jgi:hypothetical protein